jgi:hypothetical protein
MHIVHASLEDKTSMFKCTILIYHIPVYDSSASFESHQILLSDATVHLLTITL